MTRSQRAAIICTLLLMACSSAETAVTGTEPPSTGSLIVTITGLPVGTAAVVTVRGPSGDSVGVSSTSTLTGLARGTYAVEAAELIASDSSYAVTAPSQSVNVTAGGTANVTVQYAAAALPPVNLRIDGAYLTQAVQGYDGSVPLVAGRDAYLRVFAIASRPTGSAPRVGVSLYHGAAMVQSWVLEAPQAGVPTAVDEGTLSASWNVLVPGALVQNGLRVEARVDPDNAVPEADESDNRWPAEGAQAAVDVRTLPVFRVRLVPVLQESNGLQGDVTEANQEQYLTYLKQLLPVGAHDADVRAPYTTNALPLERNNLNYAWGVVLSEIRALSVMDSSLRYYYGVVRTSYDAGITGVGYVGGTARTAVGWDRMPRAPEIMAHEVGHNMGRRHAPCGSAGDPDLAYPYSGGIVGVWGLDLSTLTLKPPATHFDIMGYCSPDWVSDYNWRAMIAYRESWLYNSSANSSEATAAAKGGSGILVWGRITPQGIELEPSFRVNGPVSPPAPGLHRLELLDLGGNRLRSVSFDAVEVADLPNGPERHFAFVLPLDAERDTALAGLRVHSAGLRAERFTHVARAGADSRTAAVVESSPSATLERPGAGRLRIRWDAARYPVVMVRDAATGEVLSFARGGNATLWTAAEQVELSFSDGVRSVARRVRALQ